MYYSCKILASYSVWKWVLNDPKFCPLETQFKYIEQAHCSTESMVVSSSGWLAITMWWNLFCDRCLCCDVTSLVPQTLPFLHASKMSGEKFCIWESSEFGSEGGLWILQGIRHPVPERCDWWWETDQRWIPRTDWNDHYSSRLSSTKSLLQCSGISSACSEDRSVPRPERCTNI